MSEAVATSTTAEPVTPVKQELGEKATESVFTEPPLKRPSLFLILPPFFDLFFHHRKHGNTSDPHLEPSDSCPYCQRGSSYFLCLFVVPSHSCSTL